VDDCIRVEYLSLHHDRSKKSPAGLEGENLQDIRAHIADRLISLHDRLSSGASMPANGNQQTCDYCDYSGVCRKGGWRE
jgi:ATP-dependent helicase/nuclease subunit B